MSKRKDVTVQTIFSWAYEDDDPEPTAQEVIKNCAGCDHILDYEWNVMGEIVVYEEDMWHRLTVDLEESAETSQGCDIDEEA